MDKITELGFIEGKKKKDLFYKKIDDRIILFLDKRGLFNLFYFKILKELPEKEKKEYSKLILDEFFKCVKVLPLDFYDLTNCFNCGRYIIDRLDYGGYCSRKCKVIGESEAVKERVEYMEKRLKEYKEVKCTICGKKPELNIEEGFFYWEDKRAGHHIDYINDTKILICPSCHAKITFHLDKYPQLKKYEPIGKRKKPASKYKLLPCSQPWCNGNAKILASENSDVKPICSRCKRKIELAKKKIEQGKSIHFKSNWKYMNRPNIPRYFEETSK